MSEDFQPKDLKFVRLFDVYAPLLTPRQREAADLYFNYDLSLGEIAEQSGVSRQSVSDCLGKSRKQLEEYEEKLGFLSLLKELSGEEERKAAFVAAWTAEMRRKYPGLKEEFAGLEEGVFKKNEERTASD